jgi:signal transduction histidine kinase
MLHEFLTINRTELIERCRAKVAERSAPQSHEVELAHGISLFLDQLIKTLAVEQTAQPMQSRAVSGPSGGENPVVSEVGEAAARHGQELLEHGFTVEQVVHDYGDLCQAITELAFELEAPIETDEFRTLNRCLDNAIAGAVTAFNLQRDFLVADRQTNAWGQRLGFLAHELRNHLMVAMMALDIIKSGNVSLGGATGAVLDRSLVKLNNTIDRSLSEVRITAEMTPQRRLFPLAAFIAEVKISASLEAKVKECVLTVPFVEPELAVDADPDLLFSAVGNLLQNAFKFTHPQSEVTLSAYASGERILIDIQDHCGGLPHGFEKKMFEPFAQANDDKSGLGLGLSISRLSVEANAGILSVRDIPGEGCIFTIDLPRHSVQIPAAV